MFSDAATVKVNKRVKCDRFNPFWTEEEQNQMFFYSLFNEFPTQLWLHNIVIV